MLKVSLIYKYILIIVKLIRSFLLFLTAMLLKSLFFLIFIIWGIIEATKRKELIEYFRDMAISLDATAGVIGQYSLNKTLLRHPWVQTRFGNRRHTISYVMALNKQHSNLNKFGLWIEKILNFFDSDHLNKSIKNNEEHERLRKRIC